MKKQSIITKIISPFVLAGSLIGLPNGIESNRNLAYAQSYDDEDIRELERLRNFGTGFRSFGYIYDSGALPAQSFNDLKFYRGMSLFNHFMADHAHSQANIQELRILRNDIRRSRNLEREMEQVDINQIPQTFVANYWKDFNGDGYVPINEFVGLNKSRFSSNESAIFGMYLPLKNIKGKSYSMKVFDPRGNFIYEDSSFIKKDRCSEIASLNLDVTLREHGPGTYAINFNLNGRHWEKRQFELVDSGRGSNGNIKPILIHDKNGKLIGIGDPVEAFRGRGGHPAPEPVFEDEWPETLIFHWCKNDDLDKNGLVGYNEIKKISDKKFTEGTRISFNINPTREGAKELLETKVFSKDADELIHSDSKVNETNGKIFHVNNLNSGKYYAILKRDGKYLNDIEFEVVSDPNK